MLLEKLLDSIGTRPGVEVIVVDDNSTVERGTYQMVCDKHRSFNVVFLTNDSGIQSAGVCRNIGLDRACGKWLLFADADDYFLDGWYDIVSQYFDNEADIVFFSPTSINLKSGSLDVRHEEYSGLINAYLKKLPGAETCLRCCYYVPWSKLIRREVVTRESIRFDATRYSNDVIFSAKVGLSAKKILAVNDTIYCVTRSEHSLTAPNKNREEMIAEEFIRLGVRCDLYALICDRVARKERRYVAPTCLRSSIKIAKRYGLSIGYRYLILSRKRHIPFFNFYAIWKHALEVKVERREKT